MSRVWWYSQLLKVTLLLGGLGIVVGACSPKKDDQSPNTTITVSAAADLMFAFQEIGRAFENTKGIHVIFNFGSTGQLTEQIRQGAPVDVFAAANIAYIESLKSEGLIIPETQTLYAQGRITLWVLPDSSLNIQSLAELTRPEITRIAIANPEHAPYGVAAKEALQTVGVWSDVSSKLLLGQNVAQTLAFAQTGEVDVAIVALSLSVTTEGKWVLIPAELHTPLDQSMAVIADTKHESAARAFVAYVNSDEGRAIMRRYGFVLPGESLDLNQ